MAPRMRGAAKVLNASPRPASNASSAAMSPIVPALTISSKSAFTDRVRDICRDMLGASLAMSRAFTGGFELLVALRAIPELRDVRLRHQQIVVADFR